MLKTADISTARLQELLRECAELEANGYIGDGPLQRFRQAGNYTTMYFAVTAIYREAALRWAEMKEATCPTT